MIKIELSENSVKCGDHIAAIVNVRKRNKNGRYYFTSQKETVSITVCKIAIEMPSGNPNALTSVYVDGTTEDENPRYVSDIPLANCYASLRDAISALERM